MRSSPIFKEGLFMILNWVRENFHPLWHFRKKSAVFRWITRNIRIKIGLRIRNIDHKVYVDLLRNPYMVGSPNNYERQDLDLMIYLIPRLNLRRMFDVGANLGIYSFSFSANAQQGQVVAFEPDMINAKLFEKTNARCPRHDIVLERKAVAETSGTATFLLDDMAGATGTLRQDGATFSERNYGGAALRATVETTTIDEASNRFFPPDFIKIDVEGAELDVLKGSRQTLTTARPIMLIEISSEKALRGVQELLEQSDYILRPVTRPNYLAGHRDSDLWNQIDQRGINPSS
jgi:FkbM family methyltransferase